MAPGRANGLYVVVVGEGEVCNIHSHAQRGVYKYGGGRLVGVDRGQFLVNNRVRWKPVNTHAPHCESEICPPTHIMIKHPPPSAPKRHAGETLPHEHKNKDPSQMARALA